MFEANSLDPETKQPLELTVRLTVDGTEKVKVRWPTDEEWSQRTSKLKVVQRSVGHNETQTEAKNALEVNAALYRKICLNGHSSIDDETASYVIDRLEQCDVGDIAQDGTVFSVQLRVKGGPVYHFIDSNQITKARQIKYKRTRSDVRREGANLVVRSYLEPAAKLYDQTCAKPAEGYAAQIPIIHKAIAIDAVLEEIERILSEPNDTDGGDAPGEY